MMYQEKELYFNYVPDLDLQILGLPYVDKDLIMYILLPKETSAGPMGVHKVLSLSCYEVCVCTLCNF